VAEVVARILPAGEEAALSHSTSWRYDRGRVIVTYLVISDQLRLTSAESISLSEVNDANTPQKPAGRRKPQDIARRKVLSHGLRHLAFLYRTDPEFREKSVAGEGFLKKLTAGTAGKIG
jgi:hypothetical protein